MSAVAAIATTWTLAGCITLAPTVVPTASKSAAPTLPGKTEPAAKKKPDPAVKPKSGDASTLDKLKAQGRVQVSFKGLGGKARRTLKQTTEDIDRVEVTLESGGGFTSTQTLTRAQMMGPIASLFYDQVPIGQAALRVKAFDVAGNAIGGGDEPFEVVGGKTTEVGMSVKLGATGGVGATIAFEDAEVEDSNITGYWYVGGDGPPPEYPVIGCGDGYVWYVTQFGDSVRASSSGYNDVNAADHPGLWWSEEAYGTVHDGVIELHGRTTYTDDYGNASAAPEEAEYTLKFDADRWQMVGTRNGRPGWATPYYFDPNCNGATPGPFPYYPATPAPYPTGSGAPQPYPSGGWNNPRITVEGTLYDHNGDPVGGATVYVDSYDSNQAFSAVATTDPDGHYSISGVPTGVELEFYGETDDETAEAWQVFYGFEPVEHYDFWLNEDNDEDEDEEEDEDEDEDEDCVKRTWPTTGPDGKTFMFATCEPRPSCLPTYYPTVGPNGTTLMVQDCVTPYTPAPWGSPPPSWSPAGSPPPTWYPTTPPPSYFPSYVPSYYPSATPTPGPNGF